MKRKNYIAQKRLIIMAKTKPAVDVFSESIKSTFELGILMIPLVALGLGIVATIACLLILAPFIIVMLMAPAILVPMLIIGILAFIMALIASSAVIQGFYYKSVDEYLAKKKVSVEANLRFAISKWKNLTGVTLIQAAILFAIILAIITPFLVAGVMPMIQASPAIMETMNTGTDAEILLALAPAMGTIALGFITLMVVATLISPLVFLWFPTALFEKKSALDSVKAGYAAGKKRYLRNLAALFLMGMVNLVLSGIYMFDETGLLGLILGLWVELASAILVVKIYKEG